MSGNNTQNASIGLNGYNPIYTQNSALGINKKKFFKNNHHHNSQILLFGSDLVR